MFNNVWVKYGLELYYIVFCPVFRTSFPTVAPRKFYSLKYGRWANVYQIWYLVQYSLFVLAVRQTPGERNADEEDQAERGNLHCCSSSSHRARAGCRLYTTAGCTGRLQTKELRIKWLTGRRSTPITINCKYQHQHVSSQTGKII